MFSTSRPARLSSRGITMILSTAVLGILAALATGFYSLMVMQGKSAVRYSDMVRAEMLARGGVQYAIAQLHRQAYKKTEDPSDAWFMVDYMHNCNRRVSYPDSPLLHDNIDQDNDGDIDNPEEALTDLSKILPYSGAMGSSVANNGDRFTLQISDASSKINVNAGENLAVILDNLCRLIGPPLVAANPDMLQPNRWAQEGAGAAFATNKNDLPANLDLYFAVGPDRRPVTDASGVAVYGDGYAIAGYRARNGRFKNLTDIKNALTYVERNNSGKADDPLELLEIEVKYAALRDYITIDSWVDTNTVCVGKFEWVASANVTGNGYSQVLIDRDKSWVIDDRKNDPKNYRGSLRGSYVSIMNGHGSGQLRRIETNGIDWISIKAGETMNVAPGPISSYMIIAKEDALLDPPIPNFNPPTQLPKTNSNGTLVDDPDINYQLYPLCIHRAPVNLNTASDKVLAALFMGLNVQHGHPMSIGTDVDARKISPSPLPTPPAAPNAQYWKTAEYANRGQEPYLLTAAGLKRLPADSGKIVFDQPMPTADPNFGYLNNYGRLDPQGTLNVNEATQLAYRILIARQADPVLPYFDPATGNPVAKNTGFKRGPIHSWDDFYHRVVKLWDNSPARLNDPRKISVARMIMAHFNSNTDILKFNPNIEWIDRWGRNFTQLESVMIFDTDASGNPTQPTWKEYAFPPGPASDGMWPYALVKYGNMDHGSYYTRSYRYKSDELIDKTDMNRSTTEFSFDSGGIYEIESIGHVISGGQVLAERRVNTLVRIYNVWRETTQRQFVQGTIYKGPSAPANVAGTPYAGQIARDSNPNNYGNLLPLTTLPEPLVPLNYKIANPNGVADVVDMAAPQGRDAWLNAKTAGTPDIVANRVQPAQYDGQIALATNTTKWDPTGDANTFLASFNGDLDTDTSMGNGREQAKTPFDRRIRVLDTISVIGMLNDSEVDFDPLQTGGNGKLTLNSYATFPVAASNALLSPLDPVKYWQNVTCRMGDLRTDGIWLGNVGLSGKDATLKYLVRDSNNNYANYVPGNAGDTICMWFKSTWQGTDSHEHEFFNADNAGDGFGARYNCLVKYGNFSWTIPYNGGGDNTCAGAGGPHVSVNDLAAEQEDYLDNDVKAYLHGGNRNVPLSVRESPSYHIQPFRWSFVGAVYQWNYTMTNTLATYGEYEGFWETVPDGTTNPRNVEVLTKHTRPFIDTQREPEGPTWSAKYFWNQDNVDSYLTTDIGCVGTSGSSHTQEAAWSWADGATTGKPIFGCNNLNEKFGSWIYRGVPTDGTMAVIDEYKLSKKQWTPDRINQEQTLSRYYLPPNPSDRTQCPVFVSQSLLQSLRGFGQTSSTEIVELARVSWTVFTPRFMWEYKIPRGTRNEIVNKVSTKVPFRGPFNQVQYNLELPPNQDGERSPQVNPPVTLIAGPLTVTPLSVDRPAAQDYLAYGAKQGYATRGVEVELLDSAAADASTPSILNKTYVDPDAFNSVGTLAKPYTIKTSNLHYRVRFRYPIDPMVASIYGESATTIDPTQHYMLDTPVFDDISITYISKPQILAYKDVVE